MIDRYFLHHKLGYIILKTLPFLSRYLPAFKFSQDENRLSFQAYYLEVIGCHLPQDDMH